MQWRGRGPRRPGGLLCLQRGQHGLAASPRCQLPLASPAGLSHVTQPGLGQGQDTLRVNTYDPPPATPSHCHLSHFQ